MGNAARGRGEDTKLLATEARFQLCKFKPLVPCASETNVLELLASYTCGISTFGNILREHTSVG